MDERMEALEKRIAALEVEAQERREQWSEFTPAWKMALLNFCKEFHIEPPGALTGTE